MSDAKSPFHPGEKEIQSRLGIQDKMEEKGRRIIRDHIPERNLHFFARLPLLTIGTVDECGRPWASVLAGKPGFAHAIDPLTLGVKARPIYGDPLNKTLIDGADIGALGLDFETRGRFRVNGKIGQPTEDAFEIRVRQAFPNCPQYIQARDYDLGYGIESIGEKKAVRRGDTLNRAEAAMIAGSDTLFIASQNSQGDDDWRRGVDVSHRGGKPGFVIVAHESLLLFPDYAGNCMFSTLGNIQADPRCGLLFIDFDSGNTLQLTGEAEILWEPEHVSRFPGAERVVTFRLEEKVCVGAALPMTWRFQGFHPVLEKLDSAEMEEPAPEPRAPMTLASVNVSMPREVPGDGKTVTTGIFKKRVEGRVMVRRLNLEGDGQADLWGHGGAFRAVYAYSFENYDYWARQLGRNDFAIGQFGENFTVEGMGDDEVCVGDVFRIGDAVLEVSQPRIPCYKLALKMGIEGFQNRFLKSGRVGFYLRVLEEGEVGAGDDVVLVKRDPSAMTVREVSNLLFFDKENLIAARQALHIPALSHGWKGSFADRLAKAKTSSEGRKGLRSFVVERKEAESETITSFYLVPEDGAPVPNFLPGQFLTLELEIPGQPRPVIRTYSLSERPNPDYYRLSIKREPAPSDEPDLPAGRASNYFLDQVEVGTALRVGAPRGKFHLDVEAERAVVLLSGGVGLTPMISMLNAIVNSDAARTVWFVHGSRNGREHAMGAHVRRLARENENVHVHIRYSQPEPDDLEGRDYDSRGRLDLALMKQVLPFDDYDFFICGPTPFMRSLYCGLLSLGMSEERIHYEFFGPGSMLAEDSKPAAALDSPTAEAELAGGTQVTFARSGLTANWDPACESILDLAERQGLSLPYSCRSGICHTCECELTEGEVDYLDAPLDEPEPGHVLICCSTPKTNLVIEA